MEIFFRFSFKMPQNITDSCCSKIYVRANWFCSLLLPMTNLQTPKTKTSTLSIIIPQKSFSYLKVLLINEIFNTLPKR